MIKPFTCLFLLLSVTICKAQLWLGATAGPEFTIPNYFVGKTTGYGVNVNPQWPLLESVVSIGVVTGFTRFQSNNSTLTIIPLLASLRFRITDNRIKPVAGIDVGTSYKRLRGNTHLSGAQIEPFFPNKLLLTTRFFAGAEIELSEVFGICTSVRYNFTLGVGVSSSWGANAGLYYIFE